MVDGRCNLAYDSRPASPTPCAPESPRERLAVPGRTRPYPYTLGCAVNASAMRNLVGKTEPAAELSRVTVRRRARPP